MSGMRGRYTRIGGRLRRKNQSNRIRTYESKGLSRGLKRQYNDLENKTIIAYLRVSSTVQNDYTLGHHSISAQYNLCHKYAEENGFHISQVVKEVGSAKSIKKQKKLLNLIENNKDVTILVYNISRFSRNTREGIYLIEKMRKKNINLISIRERISLNSPGGRHNLRTHLSMAELESENIGVRVKDSLDFIKSLGGHIGSVPYGFKPVSDTAVCEGSGNEIKIKKLVPDQYECEVVKFIKLAYDGNISSDDLSKQMFKISKDKTQIDFFQGDTQINVLKKRALTYNEVADLLNDYGVLKRKKKWTSNSIRNLYKSYDKIKDNIIVNDNEDFMLSDYDEELEDELMAEITNPMKRMKI